MSVNTFDIQDGMEVFSSDGQKIGNVGEVHDGAGGIAESGAQAMSTADEAGSSDPDSGIPGIGGLFSSDDSAAGGGPASGVDRTRDPNDLREEYGTTATATEAPADTGYFKVSEGGILGLGAKQLCIPFTAVETVAADGVITLAYTKDEVVNRFDHEPDAQGESSSPDTPIV
jgi:hypothetical protein